MSHAQPRPTLEAIFDAALEAVAGRGVVAGALSAPGEALRIAGHSLDPGCRLRLLAAGKAAASMASAVEHWAGERIRAGLVVTKDDHGEPLRHCELLECAHPVPDARNPRAARAALDLARRVEADDVLLVLLSGGASALLARPVEGLSAEDFEATTRALLASGADIDEMNCVRKHLSATAGGRLAEAAHAAGTNRIIVLAISDVPGNRLDVVGSGPFHGDPTTFADALEILVRRGIRGAVPAAILEYLEAGAAGQRSETLKPGSPALANVDSQIIASNDDAIAAALGRARGLGLHAVGLGPCLRGEARDAGRRLAALARAVASDAPVCLVAGGETTVQLVGGGQGGRNQELALAAAVALHETGVAGSPGPLTLLAAGTDGTDGPTDAAGAFADAGSVARGQAAGLDAAACLADNDSYRFFDREGSLLRTGPTSTNVMDLALLWIPPRPA